MFQEAREILESDHSISSPTNQDIIELTKVFMTLHTNELISDSLDKIADKLDDIAIQLHAIEGQFGDISDNILRLKN
jgi:hypothetical protein